jgi:murein DD-endopeptidase MepM/ murein hydrolase activator NlpD
MKLALYPKGDVTQWFAENPELYSRVMGLAGHNGIDLVRPWGEPLYAVEDGIVVDVKDAPDGYGMHIRFVGDTKDKNGFQNQWVYAHNSKNLVKVGDKVTAGQHIANMGNTGFVISGATPYWKTNPYAGTHLHIGVRKVKVLKKGGFSYPGSDVKLSVQDYNNGYKGSIDPYNTLANLSDTEAEYRNTLLTLRSAARQLLALLKK